MCLEGFNFSKVDLQHTFFEVSRFSLQVPLPQPAGPARMVPAKNCSHTQCFIRLHSTQIIENVHENGGK